MLVEEKLRLLHSSIVTSSPAPATPTPDLAGLPGGASYHTRFGDCYVVEHRTPHRYTHGRITLGLAGQADAPALRLLGPIDLPADARLDRALFVDTETTGISGGTGTYPFMVGLGCYEEGDFVVRQYFMRDYSEEQALLEAVAEQLAHFSIVVTFNGKSFDLPLLETRLILSRRDIGLGNLAHLDLLHPSRRLWRHRLESCRLTDVETLIGHRRAGDVPSWVIPGLYFSYLRTGRSAPLGAVFEHNRQDILSLAALAIHLCSTLADGHQATDPCELYGAARIYEDRGHYHRALAALHRAWKINPDSSAGQASAFRLALLYKRLGQHDRAVPIWQQLARGASSRGFVACVELAKYYEHRARDRAQALGCARRALDLLEILEMLGASFAGLQRERLALEHRLNRLLRAGAVHPALTRPVE